MDEKEMEREAPVTREVRRFIDLCVQITVEARREQVQHEGDGA